MFGWFFFKLFLKHFVHEMSCLKFCTGGDECGVPLDVSILSPSEIRESSKGEPRMFVWDFLQAWEAGRCGGERDAVVIKLNKCAMGAGILGR